MRSDRAGSIGLRVGPPKMGSIFCTLEIYFEVSVPKPTKIAKNRETYAKVAPRRLKMEPKRVQERPKRVQETPKRDQEHQQVLKINLS